MKKKNSEKPQALCEELKKQAGKLSFPCAKLQALLLEEKMVAKSQPGSPLELHQKKRKGVYFA
ncbi:MAG: hypothetical protein N3F07_03715 [Candidatus Micrarchaeota archaeon]|nr:hypothetical protein [Candidatus Micrarchaeota archaeon]